MDNHVNLIRAHAEEPARLDDLETFVHHGGGIDGDAVAHFPVGMGEGLFGSYGFELREGRFAKWPAAGGENETAHFAVRSTAKALMDGVVLAVHGQKFFAGFFCRSHNKFAGGDQDFFIGERDGFSKLHGFVSGFETDDADGSGNHDVRLGVSSDGEHSLAAVMNGGKPRNSFSAQQRREFVGFFSVGYGDKLGAMTSDLAGEFFEV